jgi:hypothetical protein
MAEPQHKLCLRSVEGRGGEEDEAEEEEESFT